MVESRHSMTRPFCSLLLALTGCDGTVPKSRHRSASAPTKSPIAERPWAGEEARIPRAEIYFTGELAAELPFGRPFRKLVAEDALALIDLGGAARGTRALATRAGIRRIPEPANLTEFCLGVALRTGDRGTHH